MLFVGQKLQDAIVNLKNLGFNTRKLGDAQSIFYYLLFQIY